jgi:hypothetical protein
MTTRIARSRRPMIPVCHWCKADLDSTGSPYRTDVDGIEPRGSVGWVICTPACPSRPTNARVWKREIPDWTQRLLVMT